MSSSSCASPIACAVSTEQYHNSNTENTHGDENNTTRKPIPTQKTAILTSAVLQIIMHFEEDIQSAHTRILIAFSRSQNARVDERLETGEPGLWNLIDRNPAPLTVGSFRQRGHGISCNSELDKHGHIMLAIQRHDVIRSERQHPHYSCR